MEFSKTEDLSINNGTNQFRITIVNIALTIGIMMFVTMLSFLFRYVGVAESNMIIAYILGVLLVAKYTDGYVYGIAASVMGVLKFNFFFTEPYYTFEAYRPDYPITFVIMLISAIITSTLTTKAKLDAMERERLLKQQQESQLEVERERLRGNLLRAVSHDLRTPLTGILGATATILDHGKVLDQEVQRNLLQGVYDDASWLIHSVENILSITRIDEGNIELKKNMEAVEEVVAEAVSRMKKQSAGHTIKINIPDELIMLPMDGSLITQVLVNLIDNAVKYTADGSVIEIKTQIEGGNVVFEVSDNGKGISEETLPFIFNRFYTGASLKDTGRRGTGLGLAICRSIITAHGGEISAYNNPAGGATFRFTLAAQGFVVDNKPLILVVEDDKPIRNFICVSLEAQGYRVINTEYGKIAVTLVISHNPDMIILDLGLPDMDGSEVIAGIRPITKAAIIVVSARGLEREKVEALDSGADDYLTKPFSVGELLARIRVAFRHLQNASQSQNELTFFKMDNLTIDLEKRRVFLSDEEIHLTPMEYKLVTLMAKYAGKVLTHKFILEEIWGTYSGNDTQSLRVFMANIRRKIEKDPAQPRYILTEVGVGYRLVDE